MVAGALLAFIVVSLYAAFAFGFGLIKLAQENVRADQILVERMETLRAYNWSKISGGSYISTNFVVGFSGTNGAWRGVLYTGTVAVAPPPSNESYTNSLRQVTVTLAWTSGAPRTRSMTTFVSQYGVATYKP